VTLKRPPSWQGLASARALAEFAHLGQTDAQGLDYTHGHVSMVVSALYDQPGFEALPTEEQELALQAAWLHDAFEDTPLLWNTLIDFGAPLALRDALALLTKIKSQPRATYIRQILPSPIARAVKQADNSVNLTRSLALEDGHPDKERWVAKYSGEARLLFDHALPDWYAAAPA
jgi:(p)ppGpp synthase/HD superfamily hydrolase